MTKLHARAVLASALFGVAAAGAAAPSVHVHQHAGSNWTQWDFFTNFGSYMPRIHCMRTATGDTDWPWVIALGIFTTGVVVAYLRIFWFWRRCYYEELAEDRNKPLMTLAHIFFLCAVCGYVMSLVMFVWPAYRLLVGLLIALNFFSWRFITRLSEFRASFSVVRLQRQLAYSLKTRNEQLEKQVEERTAELQHTALHDRVTGLPNRLALNNRLAGLLDKSASGQSFAVLFLDLDRFKTVNDVLGHKSGDEFLVITGQRLQEALASSLTISKGMAARLGGDEFIVLLEELQTPGQALEFAHALQPIVSKACSIGGTDVASTASIGIAIAPGSYSTGDEILRDADIAMYRAKKSGRACHVLFDERMRDDELARSALETDLRTAIEQDQISVAYQPIVSMETGHITGFEALLRWNHPTRGTISPAVFIPIAEESGFIVTLGWWILDAACRQIKLWRETIPGAAALTVNVNLSRRQLWDVNLGGQLKKLLERIGLDAAALNMEVTESTVMLDERMSIASLNALKEVGVGLALDDFSTGLSSLICLHRFPIDTLKIDRQFILNMEQKREYMAVTQAIVTLAHQLGFKVVAEGIETDGQMAQLIALECDEGQGYHFSRPVPAETCAEMLGKWTAAGIVAAR